MSCSLFKVFCIVKVFLLIGLACKFSRTFSDPDFIFRHFWEGLRHCLWTWTISLLASSYKPVLVFTCYGAVTFWLVSIWYMYISGALPYHQPCQKACNMSCSSLRPGASFCASLWVDALISLLWDLEANFSFSSSLSQTYYWGWWFFFSWETRRKF